MAQDEPPNVSVARIHSIFMFIHDERSIVRDLKSQNVPLSSLNVQQTRTGRFVLGASSSDCSEWNIDDKWSSQEWKSGEFLGARTGRPVYDKFVIDDDMDSDTATESNFSFKSGSILNRVNDRLRKIELSSKDAMQDFDKRYMI